VDAETEPGMMPSSVVSGDLVTIWSHHVPGRDRAMPRAACSCMSGRTCEPVSRGRGRQNIDLDQYSGENNSSYLQLVR
jgi:hypothetical protein